MVQVNDKSCCPILIFLTKNYDVLFLKALQWFEGRAMTKKFIPLTVMKFN